MAASLAVPDLPGAPQKALAGMAHKPTSPKANQVAAESPYLAPEPQADAQDEAAAAPTETVASDATAKPTQVAAMAKSSSKKKKQAGGGGGSSSKKKKKKKGGESVSDAPCVGLYVDALDLKMLWGEAQIIDCNIEEKKLKVHFIGWKSSYDLWTDCMSVAGHALTKKSVALRRRWDGKSSLFSETEEQQTAVSEKGDNEVLAPPKETPSKTETEMPSSAQKVEASASAPSAATSAVPDAPAVSAAKDAPVARKSRPAKIAAEKAGVEAPLLSIAAPKRSLPSKSERGSVATVAITKKSPAVGEKVATIPVAVSEQKKRSKSPVPKTSGSSGGGSTTASVGPVDVATSSSRPYKRLKESVELVQVANGAPSVDFAAARKQNVADDEQTASFLQRCASVWQRQLSAVTSRQS